VAFTKARAIKGVALKLASNVICHTVELLGLASKAVNTVIFVNWIMFHVDGSTRVTTLNASSAVTAVTIVSNVTPLLRVLVSMCVAEAA
jgi:hypothetical protein